jgi:hypothetical protein
MLTVVLIFDLNIIGNNNDNNNDNNDNNNTINIPINNGIYLITL